MDGVFMKKLQQLLKEQGEQELSLSILTLQAMQDFLKSHILEEKLFNHLITKGDEDVKVLIALNPHLSREQWLSLYLSNNQKIHKAACNNASFDPSNEEKEIWGRKNV